MKNKYLRIIPVIIVAVVIFVLSSIEIPFTPADIPIGIIQEKSYLLLFLHIGEFGLFSTSLMIGFYPQVKSYFLLIISILYGIIDEIHQYITPTRYFDGLDILCNIIGAILGVLFCLVLLFIIRKIRTPKWVKDILLYEIRTSKLVKETFLDEVKRIEQFQELLEKED